jgi:hypothetical protein
MTTEEKRAYQRGYNNRAHQWPEHKPPLPPNEIISGLMVALKNLRDAVDLELAKIDPEDEWTLILGPKVDACDAAMSAVSKWLRE